MYRITFFILGLLAAATIDVRAQAVGKTTVAIGNVCFGEVQEVPLNIQTRMGDGTWNDFEYSVQPPAAGPPSATFIILGKPLQPKPYKRSCAQVISDESQRGNRPVLSGALLSLRMTGSVFTAVHGGNRFQIKEGELEATLIQVNSLPGDAHGGKVDLRGSDERQLRIARTLLTEDAHGRGVVEVTGKHIKLARARVEFPGGASATADLAPEDPDAAATFALDVNTRRWSLAEGKYASIAPTPIRGGAIDGGAVVVAAPEFAAPARGIEVAARRAGATATVAATIAGRAASVTAGSEVLSYTLGAPSSVSADRIDLDVRRNASGFVGTSVRFENLKARSQLATFARGTQTPVAVGQVILTVASATANALSASSRWTNPDLPAMSFFLPTGSVKSARWDLSGPVNALSVSGDMTSTRERFGNILTEARAAIQVGKVRVADEVRFPIRVDTKAQLGTFTVQDSNQIAVITGTLNRLHLDGQIVLTLDDISKSKVEFPARGIAVALQGLAATTPLIAGTTPAFGALNISAENQTAVSLSQAGATGRVDLKAEAMTLGDPIIQIGPEGSEARAKLTLITQGDATLAVDLATSKVLLAKADFSATDLDFALLDAGKWIDLGGTRIVDPKMHVASFSIHIDKTPPSDVGTAELTTLVVDASSISKPRDPGRPNEVAFSGKPDRPLELDRLTASRVSAEGALSVLGVSLSGFRLHLVNVDLALANQARVRNATFGLSLESALESREEDQTHYTLTNLHLVANGTLDPGNGLHLNNDPGFLVDVNVSGRDDHLTGSGTAILSGFTGSLQTKIDTGFECSGGATHKVPVEGNFAIAGPIGLAAHFQDGELSLEGRTGAFGLLVHTTGYSACNGESKKHVISPEHETWTWGFCSEWLKPYRCKWSAKIEEVNIKWHPRIEVHMAGAAIAFSYPVVRIDDGNLRLCNIGAFGMPAMAAIGSVRPEIESNFPDADNIINGVTGVFFTASESTILSTIGNGAGWTASVTGSALGNFMCIR